MYRSHKRVTTWPGVIPSPRHQNPSRLSNQQRPRPCILRSMSRSVSARCYWMIYKNIPIAASVHGSAPQQLNLLNATNVFMRLDHFSVVGIRLAKCKIRNFTNHWPSVNQWRQYRSKVISKCRADVRPLGNWHRPNIRPMFLCYSGRYKYLIFIHVPNIFSIVRRNLQYMYNF